MVMCQAEPEQQSIIALYCVAGGEQNNNGQPPQSLHIAFRGAEAMEPCVTEVSP